MVERKVQDIKALKIENQMLLILRCEKGRNASEENTNVDTKIAVKSCICVI